MLVGLFYNRVVSASPPGAGLVYCVQYRHTLPYAIGCISPCHILLKRY